MKSEQTTSTPINHIKALYQLNIEAKRYGKQADEVYRRGMGAQAKKYSTRKKAIYSLKDKILHQWFDQNLDGINSIERHSIDDREYICFYVCGFSFHSPIDYWSEQSVEISNDNEATELADFDTDPETREDVMNEREALETLATYDSANYHLDPVFIDRGQMGPRFAGWEYLPGVAEHGGKVDEGYLSSEKVGGPEHFDIGDRLIDYRLSDSPVEITAKYYMWWGNSQIAAYDAQYEDTGHTITLEETDLPRDIASSDDIEVIDQ